MLRVYLADDCPGSPMARLRAAQLRERAPDLPVEVVDVGAHDAMAPPAVFGTPTYTWNDRIIFLGNPSEQELFECVRILHERASIGDTARKVELFARYRHFS